MSREADAVRRIGRRLQQDEYERLEDRVEAYGEILKDVHAALRAINEELVRLRSGGPPPGTVARY
jgi:hypothetical protein